MKEGYDDGDNEMNVECRCNGDKNRNENMLQDKNAKSLKREIDEAEVSASLSVDPVLLLKRKRRWIVGHSV